MWEPRRANETLTCTEVATFGLGFEWMSWILTSREGRRGVLSRGDSMRKSKEV